MKARPCAAACAATAAASGASHARGSGARPASWARISGQAGSRSVRVKSRLRFSGNRPVVVVRPLTCGHLVIMIHKPEAAGHARDDAALKAAQQTELAMHRERVREATERVIEASRAWTSPMAALLVRRQAGHRIQPRSAGAPAAGILRESSITGPSAQPPADTGTCLRAGLGQAAIWARVSGLCPEVSTTSVPGVRPAPDAAGMPREDTEPAFALATADSKSACCPGFTGGSARSKTSAHPPRYRAWSAPLQVHVPAALRYVTPRVLRAGLRPEGTTGEQRRHRWYCPGLMRLRDPADASRRAWPALRWQARRSAVQCA
jgi:hypothetical protein